MKLLITYALLNDLNPLIQDAVAAINAANAPTAIYHKLGTGRRLSRGHEVTIDARDRDELLHEAQRRILHARTVMKDNPLYWRPLLAAWRALEQRLIMDWPNSAVQRQAA